MAGTRTIAAAPSLRPERLPGTVRTVCFALVVLGIEAVLAASLVDERFSRFLLLFGAVAATAFVFRFPLVAALALLGLTDFIFLGNFFTFAFGPIEVRPFEPVLAALLGVATLQPRRQSWGGATGVALAAFLLLVAFSGALAITSGRADLSEVLAWGRPFALLTFFYVVVRLFPSAQQRRTLLIGAAVVAAVTGVVALLVALGWSVGDTLQGTSSQIVQDQEGIGGVQRVRLPGLSLGYALFWYVAVQIVASRGLPRWSWITALAGIAIDIAVSFNRNMWLGLVGGLALLIAAGGPLLRSRFVAALAAVVAGLSVVTLAGGSDEGRLLEPVVQRASTILSPGQVTRESSLQDREKETDVAWETARENLLIGVGPGASFGLLMGERVDEDTFVRVPQLFLHNQYLYLVLIAGVGGLFTFVAFLGIPLVQAFRRAPRNPAIMACGAGIAMIMMSAVVAIYFTVDDMTMALALLAGVIVADGDELADDRLDPDLAG